MRFVDNLKAKVAEMIEQKEEEKARKAALKQAQEEKKQEKVEEDFTLTDEELDAYMESISSIGPGVPSKKEEPKANSNDNQMLKKDEIIKMLHESNNKKEEEVRKRNKEQGYEIDPELEKSIKELENQLDKEKEEYAQQSIKNDQEITELYARINAVYNSPGSRKASEVASRAALGLQEEALRLKDQKIENSKERKEFSDKYRDIWHIFSSGSREVLGIDQYGYFLDDRYKELPNTEIFKNVPLEFLEYPYLFELNQKGLTTREEQQNLQKIEDSKFDKAKLYLLSIVAYNALGCYDVTNDNGLFVNRPDLKPLADKTREEIYENLNTKRNQQGRNR